LVKNYVLDTNVLIHDPNSIYSFEDNNVVIPLPVLEELDKLKTHSGSVGKAARDAIRALDKLRSKGQLSKGVPINGNGTLRVHVIAERKPRGPDFLYEKYLDNWILTYTLDISQKDGVPTFLVSKDINLRVKASALGIPAQDYLTDRSDLDLLPPGYKDLTNVVADPSQFDMGQLEVVENEYVKIGNEHFKANNGKLKRLLLDYKSSIWGINALNTEQLYAIDALLDDDISMVTIVGIAGTGKTLISLACALEKTVRQSKYRRIIVTRPMIPLGKDVGYLPGSLEEKLKPWMQPIFDNLEFLFDRVNMRLKDFLKKDVMEIEALSFIRGRSIPDQYIVIDEAQNLTPHEVKTILTRVGERSKVVLIGDPYQIDTPYLDKSSNGLVYAAARMSGNEKVAHITLVKGERSELANLAAKLL